MTKLLIWIPGNKVENNQPTERFRLKIEKAIEIHNQHLGKFDTIEFLVSGRWHNSTDDGYISEARIASEFIKQAIPDAIVYEEKISVDTIGNIAFSKPIIMQFKPDRIIGVGIKFHQQRMEYLIPKIFGDDIQNYKTVFVEDQVSLDTAVQERNAKALEMNKRMLANIQDGDDKAVREFMLYKTPYYFRLTDEQNRLFFDTYWSGGFEDFIGRRQHQLNQK